MSRPSAFLVVLNRGESDVTTLAKAARLVRSFGTALELFVCDAERAYALKHDYEESGRRDAMRECVANAKAYLSRQKSQIDAADIAVSIDAVCESPLYEGILHKAHKSRPELVIKAVGGGDRPGHSHFDANDWQLMHTCPATLALVRDRPWRKRLHIATAIDVSDEETEGLAHTILGVAKRFAIATDAELDVIYAERAPIDSPASRLRADTLHALAREASIERDDVHILAGDPERHLAAFAAQRNYDLVVLGALAHRKGAVSLVGTLTSVLVEALACDFVLVMPETHR